MKLKKIKRTDSAMRVNMGGIFLDQALPLRGLDQIDPFLLIHHWADEMKGGQNQEDVGVGPHPHRGFSPVTFIFDGSIHHRDSIGHDEVVEKGGTQWMNSGSGLVHSERPSKELAKKGGRFEIIQFWVNSPSTEKMKDPSYQPLTNKETKWIYADNEKVKIGVVAGDFDGKSSTIKTDSELLIMRLEMKSGGKVDLEVPEDYNSLVYTLDGKLKVNDEKVLITKDMAQFEIEEGSIRLEAEEDLNCILLSGKPIGEEVSTYGPFVMNTHTEIIQALNDYQNGEMGELIENFD